MRLSKPAAAPAYNRSLQVAACRDGLTFKEIHLSTGGGARSAERSSTNPKLELMFESFEVKKTEDFNKSLKCIELNKTNNNINKSKTTENLTRYLLVCEK